MIIRQQAWVIPIRFLLPFERSRQKSAQGETSQENINQQGRQCRQPFQSASKFFDIIAPMDSSSRPSLWTRHSSILLGGFLLTGFLIVYIWWPLAEEYLAYIDWNGPWWLYMDWLLLGVFLFMSFTIIARADLRTDTLIVFVGIFGGLAIESWGTQTNLWHYYTAERPPLWIIPAWPIASLSIDRITRFLDWLVKRFTTEFTEITEKNAFKISPGTARHRSCREHQRSDPVDDGARRQGRCVNSVFSVVNFKVLYWLTFAAFLTLMLVFVSPTFDKSFTWLSLALCVLLILTPTDHRFALLTFVAGAGLGYFLELWGTTRECWTYYTYQTPPLFAVLAHGMAAVAFWRTGLMVKLVWGRIRLWRPPQTEIQEEA